MSKGFPELKSPFFVLKNIHHGVATLQFNRPKHLNCFHEPMWMDYKRLLLALDLNPLIRVVVISGMGDTFCAGLDLKFFSKVYNNGSLNSKRKMFKFIKNFQNCISTPLNMKKPTIGVIHGKKNFGLALELIACFTIKLFTSDSLFSLNEIELGIVPDLGILQRVAKQSQNVSLLSKIAMTSSTFGVQEVLELGLCSKQDIIDNGYEEAMRSAIEMGKTIGMKEEWCITAIKTCVEDISERDLSVKRGLDKVIQLNVNNMKPNLSIKSKL